ncbi:MAG: DUF1343 domain-containing protein [Bacteroidales bacterium]|nr:DUF1343 domain-containing protein [Bacteroidales bacterium]
MFDRLKRTVIVVVALFSINTVQAQILVGAACTDHYLPLLEGKRVAVCGNQTSMVGNTHLVDTLIGSGVRPIKIFCPEHGFRGNAEAGAHIASSTDPQTGIPIVSLYGKNKKPTPEQMADIDIVLFDLQDVGCRFYTYISTLHYVMEAAAESGKQVIVLDRPNPNGYYVDGPVLDAKFSSFVGMHPVPVVYGMTIGEYARMINGERWLKGGVQCALTVIEMEGYTHQTRYALPVPPSPNLQTSEAILLYPSLCFFEGAAVSVGRGTPTPFQIYGFPGLRGGDYAFTPVAIKGVSENPPYKDQKCQGFDLTAFATDHLDSAGCLQIDYLLKAYRLFPDKEKFFTNASFFDKLAGTDRLRQQVVRGVSEKDIRASWQEGLEKFKAVRERYLLYE